MIEKKIKKEIIIFIKSMIKIYFACINKIY